MQKAVEKLHAVTIVSSDPPELFRPITVVLFQGVKPFWLDPVG